VLPFSNNIRRVDPSAEMANSSNESQAGARDRIRENSFETDAESSSRHAPINRHRSSASSLFEEKNIARNDRTRTLADGFARFQRDVPRQRHSASGGEGSQLDRDTNRAGFTVAIIPINRARPSALGDSSYELARSSRHLRIGSRGAVFEPRASAGPSRKFPLADLALPAPIVPIVDVKRRTGFFPVAPLDSALASSSSPVVIIVH